MQISSKMILQPGRVVPAGRPGLVLLAALSFLAASVSAVDTVDLPAAIDLRPAFQQWNLPLRSQGHRGTCSVFTMTGAIEYALASHQQYAGTVLSVEFLNWASNQATSNSADGGFFADLWKGYEHFGICPETNFPYRSSYEDGLQPELAATSAAKAMAEATLRLHWIKPWNVTTGLTEKQFLELKRTLVRHWPVCGGFRWPKRAAWQKQVLQMAAAADVFDGHSVLLVGYQDDPAQPGGGVFWIRNSNSGATDEAMPYEYVRTFMNDAAWVAPTKH